MDEDTDDDSALSNLHHGLESSFDEDMNGSSKQDLRSVHHSNSVDSRNEDMVTENQINLLQDMVVEMKQGFQAALQELAKIQHKEEAEGNHSKQLQQQQQRQLDHLTETIVEFKQQLSSLTRNVEQIMDEQKTLKSRLDEVSSSKDSSQENKISIDRGSSKRPSLVDDHSAHSEEWKTKFSGQPTETGTNRTVNEVTSVACKGLSLTQALGEECLKLSFSQSSNDDEDDQELLRLSRYRRKSGHLVFNQTADRQHAKSGGVGTQDKHKTVLIAAQRQKAVMELADSERDYSSQLWSLLHTYLTPLQTAGFLSARELDTLFPLYLEQMYTDHCHICTGLQDRLIHWTYAATVADLLERFTDSYSSDSLLSLYKEYAEDLPAALSCLRRAQTQSSEFRLFLKAVQHSSCQSETLMSLLLVPAQRIPKFLLQLQEVSRHTPATHTDFPHLQSLLHHLQLFVDQLNDDLFHMVHDLNSDKQTSRSDYLNGHTLNGRDSGIHSNSTEEDNLISARALSNTRKSYVSSEWLDNPYYGANTRQPWSSSGRASALSQPDLTAYSSVDRVAADPFEYSHIPRSQSALPTTDGDDGSSDAAARRQVHKFKIRRRNPSPIGYTATQDLSHSNISPRVRPSSAVDFLSHSQHQQYHKHNSSDIYGASRSFQHPGPIPRPQSALGQHHSSHRPIVISRKNIRRTSGPSSNTFWNETKTSSASQVRSGHQKTNLAPEDLFPSCSILQRRADVLDGHGGYNEEDDDDTRASDSILLDTYESRLNGHDHGVNNRYEIGQDLPQSHFSYQMVKSQVYNAAKSAESGAELVTDDVPRHLYSTKQETTVEGRGLRRGSKDLTKPKSMSLLKCQPSQSVTSQINHNADMKEMPVVQTEAKDIEQSAGNSSHFPRPDHRNAKEQTTVNESSPLSEVFLNGDNSIVSVSSSGFNVSQENAELEPSLKRHGVKAALKPESAVNDYTENDRSKHVSETNRQFLLMLSSRNSAIGKRDLAHPQLTGTNIENSGGNVIEISKSPSLQSNSDTSDSLSPDQTSTSRRVLPYIPPRPSRIGNNQVNQPPITTGTIINHGNTKPTLPPKRHLKHSASSPSARKDGIKESTDLPDLESPLKYDHNSPPTLSSSTTTYPQSPSILSRDASILSQISLSLENQHSPNRPKPLFTSSTTSMPDPPPEFSSEATSKVNGQNYDGHASYSSSHEPQPLDLADLAANGEKGRRHTSLQYRMKDEGSIVSSDNYSMASDDHANVRKKMHFKASLKNLFAKKKGRVVLADIERQVVIEMAKTGVAGGARAPISTSATSPALTNMTYSGRSIARSHSGEIGTSHKTTGEALIEAKTQKDQGCSTSSPVKMYRKFRFRTRSEPDADNASGSGQAIATDCQQNQPEKNMLKCLSLRNKRHGIILDNPDADIVRMLEAGGDSACSLEQGSYSRRHSYTQDRSSSSQPYLLQRPQSEVMACAPVSDGMKSHAKSGEKRILPEQAQKQNYLRNCMEVRKATPCEPDLLQFASGYKNSKHKAVHTMCTDKVVSSSGASDTEQNAQKCSSYRPREHDMKKSGFDLCQQCQNNEMRQMGPTEGAATRNQFANCELQEGAVGIPDTVSDNSRNCPSKVVPDYRGFGDVCYTLAQTLSQPCCVLNGVQDPRTAEQIKRFSYNDDQTISGNDDCTGDKLEDETCRNTAMANSFSLPYVQRMKKEKLGDRSRFGTLSPVYEQPSPKCSQAAQSMPDVARCSTFVTGWSDCTGPSTEVIQSPPASLLCHSAQCGQTSGLEFSDAIDTKTSLSSASTEFSTKLQVSSSPFHVSSSHQKLSPSGKLDHGVSDSQPPAAAETIAQPPAETSLHKQLPTVGHAVPPKCDPNKESCRNPSTAEDGNEIFVKCSSLEDRESFEHRYRLYYDDETDASKINSLLENPKSLKALSASCVIREHFRQSPWNETSSCFKNHPASDPLLTLEVPLIDITDKKQQTANSASSDQDCPDGNQDGRKVTVYPFRHLPYTGESLCSGLGTAVLNICRSQTSPHLSGSSPLAGRLSLQDPGDHANNPGPADTSSSHRDSPAAANNSHPPTISKRHQVVIFKVNDNETSLKLPPLGNGHEEDIKHAKPVVSDSYQESAASSIAVDYDESNSYKPKNPRPISQLPNECQTVGCLRSDGPCSEDSPDASGTSVHSKHPPEPEAAVPSSYTKSTSLSHESLLSSSINQGADKTYTQFHSDIQLDQNSLFDESCLARSWSFSKGRDHSSPDASSAVSARPMSPAVYFCKQSADDPFLQEGCTFLRTSSPYDPTSSKTNWPRKPMAAPSCKDSALSTNNPGSTTPMFPEADRNTAKDITKSLPKEVLSEKEDKCPRHTAYGRMKATFDEDSNCQKNCKKWMSLEGSTSVPNSNHNSNSRRHRHSTGAKFRCQEQQFYQSQNPRYSADSNPLIQTAFLQKMACLPEYMIKHGGNLQVDEKTSYTVKTTGRHAKIHLDVTRKSYGPIDGKSSRTARSSSSKTSSLPGASSEAPEIDLGLPSYESYHQRANRGSITPETAQASPDLLPSKEPSRDDANAKDKTSACKKAQSFFSKLTNSPMSFFYKESKPSNAQN